MKRPHHPAENRHAHSLWRRWALRASIAVAMSGFTTSVVRPSMAQSPRVGTTSSDQVPEWAEDSARHFPETLYPRNSIVGSNPPPRPLRLPSTRVAQAESLPAPYDGTRSVVTPQPYVEGYPLPSPTYDPSSGDATWMHGEPIVNAPIPSVQSGCNESAYGVAACDPNGDFAPTPLPSGALQYDGCAAASHYDTKHDVPTQRPWIEWGFPFYGSGITPPGIPLIGFHNACRQRFYLYGDYRAGIGGGRNATGDIHALAHRLNLEADWQLTAAGRLHGGFQPFSRGVEFMRVDFGNDGPEFVDVVNPNFVTGFYEGDLGVMVGGLDDSPAPFDLPFSVGLLPLFYQNGIWMDDAVVGAAFAIPSRNSPMLGWPNFDATFFAAVDNVNSPTFGADNHAGRLIGSAWFIDAYDGYIEADWAYINDHDNLDRSYHNAAIGFTRRYFGTISNSVRGIFNFGQEDRAGRQTADGALFLVENSLITPLPLQLVPYANAFIGTDRPQSVARAAQAGGILRNTGINFETDGLLGYPTLDATGNNTYGGAVGVNWLGLGLDRQVVLETAFVRGMGDQASRVLQEDELAVGGRFQRPLTNATLIRFDAMYGWRESIDDLWGARFEYRWKF